MDIYMKEDYKYSLLENVHLYVKPPSESGKTYLTQGNFSYFHYKCDNYDDVGWGCGYRTLQTMCSWIRNLLESNKLSSLASSESTLIHAISSSSTSPSSSVSSSSLRPILPSILEIQTTLINLSDKPDSFFGSREWIGTLEAFYVVDALYDVPCKVLHIPHNEDIKKYANIVKKYFEDYGGFIMMGGDVDSASKGIAGIHISGNQAYFLVIDPHFVGKLKSPQELIETNFVRWQHSSQFVDSSFYNLCLPQIKLKN